MPEHTLHLPWPGFRNRLPTYPMYQDVGVGWFLNSDVCSDVDILKGNSLPQL